MDVPEKFLNLTATGWTAIGSIVGAISIIALAVFNVFYLKIARSASRAANEQAQAASKAIKLAAEANQIQQDAFQQQQRPWVGLDEPSIPALAVVSPSPVEVGPVSIDKDGTASAQYRIRFKNFGDAPAQAVLATAVLMVTEDLKDIEAEQASLTKPNQDKNVGTLLFPGGIASTVSASAFPAARMKSATFDHLFEVWLVGTIRYWDRFGNHYHTGFRYWMIDPAHTPRPFRFSASPNSTVTNPFWPQGTGGFIK